MRKSDRTAEEILPEYDFNKGIRGKYVHRLAEGANVVALAPDMARIFRDSESVNRALRLLVEVARRSAEKEQ